MNKKQRCRREIKYLALAWNKGWAIPLFENNKINRAIDELAKKFKKQRTYKRRDIRKGIK